MNFWVKYLNIFFAPLNFSATIMMCFFSIFGLVNRLCRHLEPSSRCLLEIFADQLGLLSLIIVTCNWNQAIFTLFARDLCWSAWHSQSCHHPHVQLEPGRLHVVRSRSLMISLAFSAESSFSRATGTGPSSRYLLEIFADQLGFPWNLGFLELKPHCLVAAHHQQMSLADSQ